jgi:hypothetical protein
VFIISCQEKNNDNITPTYKNQSGGTGANPCIGCITVTGTSTVTNPATQNTALQVGGSIAGWSFDGCATSPNTLTGRNGNTTVQLTFGGGAVTTGTYALTPNIPLAGQARMIVTNAPGQPTGIAWYSKSGFVSVTTSTAGTQANFNNIQCLQYSFLFPVVTVSGNLTCI